MQASEGSLALHGAAARRPARRTRVVSEGLWFSLKLALLLLGWEYLTRRGANERTLGRGENRKWLEPWMYFLHFLEIILFLWLFECFFASLHWRMCDWWSSLHTSLGRPSGGLLSPNTSEQRSQPAVDHTKDWIKSLLPLCCKPVCLSVCLSVCLPVCLFVCLFVCLPPSTYFFKHL